MRTYTQHLLIMMAAATGLFGCSSSADKNPKSTVTMAAGETWTGDIIADPIIYEVLVKNPDLDDEWASEKIRKLKVQAFVNTLFDAVYEGRAIPYNYHTGEEMSIEEVRQLEASEEFDRSLIGKLQFDENWYFDTGSLRMKKEVRSVLLAYEVYDQFDEVMGYKAAFLIHLNSNAPTP